MRKRKSPWTGLPITESQWRVIQEAHALMDSDDPQAKGGAMPPYDEPNNNHWAITTTVPEIGDVAITVQVFGHLTPAQATKLADALNAGNELVAKVRGDVAT